MYIERRQLNPAGLRRAQESRRPLHERTRLLKAYCSAVVPGFLQVPGYSEPLLSAITAFPGTPDDVEEAVAARMSRNRMLRSGNHHFALLVEESVLAGRVLTVHNSYAWALVAGVKTTEERAWTTSYRGRVFIHARKRRP